MSLHGGTFTCPHTDRTPRVSPSGTHFLYGRAREAEDGCPARRTRSATTKGLARPALRSRLARAILLAIAARSLDVLPKIAERLVAQPALVDQAVSAVKPRALSEIHVVHHWRDRTLGSRARRGRTCRRVVRIRSNAIDGHELHALLVARIPVDGIAHGLDNPGNGFVPSEPIFGRTATRGPCRCDSQDDNVPTPAFTPNHGYMRRHHAESRNEILRDRNVSRDRLARRRVRSKTFKTGWEAPIPRSLHRHG